MQKKYQAPEETEIIGAAILAVTTNIKVTAFADLIEAYGFTDIDPEKWYKLQHALNFYKDLSQRLNKVENMIAIGIRVFENINIPPNIDTMEKAMQLLNTIQRMNLRNFPDDWDNIIEVINKNHVRITERGPFPHDLIYGYFFGICKNILSMTSSFRITRKFINEDNPDSAGAIYDIIWS